MTGPRPWSGNDHRQDQAAHFEAQNDVQCLGICLLKEPLHVVVNGNHFLVRLVEVALQLSEHFILERGFVVKVLRLSLNGLRDTKHFVQLPVLPSQIVFLQLEQLLVVAVPSVVCFSFGVLDSNQRGFLVGQA